MSFQNIGRLKRHIKNCIAKQNINVSDDLECSASFSTPNCVSLADKETVEKECGENEDGEKENGDKQVGEKADVRKETVEKEGGGKEEVVKETVKKKPF